MRLLGPITRIQVQRDPLKVKGESYDPGGILAVAEGAIGPQGIVGRHEGTWVLDAHHAAHPRSRGGGRRALSMGFAGHYALMADRFGSAPLGCAGENLIVGAVGRFFAHDLAGTLVVRSLDGEVELRGARVAAPCAEFTSWMKRLDSFLPAAEQPEDVAFLDDGMRGFILEVSHLQAPVVVRLGDEVWVD